MKLWLINDEFEIEAPNFETAYEVANEMGIVIETVDLLEDR
jgi:hypothetical protein